MVSNTKLRPCESENKELEVKKEEMEKQINLWLRKKTDGTWTVFGFVRDIDTDDVIAGANVYLDRRETQTNERGFFSFDGVEKGRHQIFVLKDGYEDTGDPNKPSKVEFTL